MAERIEAFTIAVTAGTLSTAPTMTATRFDPGDVERIEIMVPSGHAGFTGFQIAQASQAIIPYDGATFVIADDETISWPVVGFLNSGDWSFRAYNEDIYDHSFYLRFLVNEPRAQTGLVGQLVTPLAL